MQRRDNVGRWGTHRAALLGVVLLALAGCGSTKAAKGTGGGGSGIAQSQCGPGDTTESCCLKTHPGQYERCGALPPNRDRPNPLLPRIPSKEEQTEWNNRCAGYYADCQEKIEGLNWGRTFGESQCRACAAACRRTGEWPAEANGHPCPEL